MNKIKWVKNKQIKQPSNKMIKKMAVQNQKTMKEDLDSELTLMVSMNLRREKKNFPTAVAAFVSVKTM